MKKRLTATLVIGLVGSVLLAQNDNNQPAFELSVNANLNKPIAAPLNVEKSNLHVDTAHINQPTETTTTTQITPTPSCISHEQLDNDPRQQIAHQWLDDTMGVNQDTLANLYAYSSEQDLLDAANQGDSTAMLALGINYKWQATHQNFQANILRPKELPDVEYQTKKFDKEIMTKARYWLMQAALNNQLMGLSEIAFSYSEEIKSTDNVELKEALQITLIAYFFLADAMQPVAEQLVAPNFIFTDDIDKQQRLELEQSKLIAQWQADRTNLGMNAALRFNPPEEVKAYFKLQRNLCGQQLK